MSQAAGYMRIQIMAMAVMSYQRLSGGALQASGDSVTPLKAATVTRVTHLALSPILIFGVWWFPRMGLPGAATANLVAQLLGVGINFFALASGTGRLHLSLRGYAFDKGLSWRLVKVGAPAAVTGMQRAMSQLIVIGIVAPFGDAALAAFALTRRAENVVNQSSRGLGRAAGALAAQNLGAGYADRAKSSVKWSIIYVSGASLSLAAVFLLFPEAVASFFNGDPEFVARAGRWLSIVAVGYFSTNARAGPHSGVQYVRRHDGPYDHHAVDRVAGGDTAGILAGEPHGVGRVRGPLGHRHRHERAPRGVSVVLRQRALAQDGDDLRPLPGLGTQGNGAPRALCYSCTSARKRNAVSPRTYGSSS